MKRHLLFATCLMMLSLLAKAQNKKNAVKKFSLKFNSGMVFSKPGDELGTVATKGKAMQLFTSAEAAYHINFSSKTKFGFKVAGVIGSDYANFLSNDRSTELKVSVTNFRARVYPFAYCGRLEDGLEQALPGKMPFLIQIPVWLGIYSSFNSLHFDYGTANGSILETAYSSVSFQDVTVKRNMSYFGWGFQPQIFESESSTWAANAVFDFGKYSWTNANGRTSSFKTSYIGFGVQYRF